MARRHLLAAADPTQPILDQPVGRHRSSRPGGFTVARPLRKWAAVYVLRNPFRLPPLLVWIGLSIAVLSVPFLSGWLLRAAGIMTGIAVGLLAVIQVSALIPQRRQRHPRSLSLTSDLPFISVHVVLNGEHFASICRCLGALARLTYPAHRFEVIVVDSRSESAKSSLEKRCLALGPSFRYHRISEVPSSRAAALNTARRLMSPNASLIAVVHAECQVAPHFLRLAAAAMDSREISHAQFPQAFGDPASEGVVIRELLDYASFNARSAGTSTLPSGSLCVIRRGALAEVGGWSDSTIAEETELGTRLIAAGFHGRYVSVESGHDPVPADFSELANLRFRRAFGNAQCLSQALRHARIPRNGLLRFMRVLQQLCGWLDFQAVALGLALIALAGTLLAGGDRLDPDAFAGAIGLWAIAALLGALPVALATNGSISERLRACLIHQALMPEATWGTLQGLLGRTLPPVKSTSTTKAVAYRPAPARASSASPFLAAMFVLSTEILLPLATLSALVFFQITLESAHDRRRPRVFVSPSRKPEPDRIRNARPAGLGGLDRAACRAGRMRRVWLDLGDPSRNLRSCDHARGACGRNRLHDQTHR
jgi:hypothetical protein